MTMISFFPGFLLKTLSRHRKLVKYIVILNYNNMLDLFNIEIVVPLYLIFFLLQVNLHVLIDLSLFGKSGTFLWDIVIQKIFQSEFIQWQSSRSIVANTFENCCVHSQEEYPTVERNQSFHYSDKIIENEAKEARFWC